MPENDDTRPAKDSAAPESSLAAVYEKPRIAWCETLELRKTLAQSCTKISAADPQCDIGSGGTPAT